MVVRVEAYMKRAWRPKNVKSQSVSFSCLNYPPKPKKGKEKKKEKCCSICVCEVIIRINMK